MGIHQEYHLIHLENVHVTSHDVVSRVFSCSIHLSNNTLVHVRHRSACVQSSMNTEIYKEDPDMSGMCLQTF